MADVKTLRVVGLAPLLVSAVFAQTLYVPGGTVGTSSNGNVGIGVSNPSSTLEVAGTATFETWIGGRGAAGDKLSIFGSRDDPWGKDLTIKNGLVGIGINTPVDRLHILDANGTSGKIRIEQTGVASWSMGVPASQNALVFAQGSGLGTEMLRLKANGAVGIGESDPWATLHVTNSIGTAASLLLENAVSTRLPVRLEFMGDYDGTGTPRSLGQIYAQADGTNTDSSRITVQTRNSIGDYVDVLSVKNGGVGIGTTNPAQKLHVVDGDIGITDIGSGQVAQLSLDSDNGTGDILFNNQGSLKFVVRGELDGNGGTLDLADRTSGHQSRLYIDGAGDVGIGTTNPSHKLAVNGTIRAKEVIVDTGWADYVFAEDYRLVPLSEVEAHIKEKGHLPDVPSAEEVAASGISVGEIQSLLLAKIEELTLHVIRQEKQHDQLLSRIASLEAENQVLRLESHR